MPQHLLFDEDGAFKAGTVLSATDASFQVELVSGKRTKVKASHVMLRFEQPAPSVLLQEAPRAGEAIDLDFLWECAPQEEFAFDALAREYYGHAPDALEAAAILFRLHGAPVYFHRKSRGRFRPAPPDVLKAALAAVERKRQQEALRQQYVEALKSGAVPETFARHAVALLVRPDRNGVEYRALEQAASELHLSPLRLLLKLGAIESTYRWHVDSFVATTFPRGTGFAGVPAIPLPSGDLPSSNVPVFSIDDSATTEIDDGFSVQRAGERVRVGIHIAAPATAIPRGHVLDEIAKARMSTVYAPGLKYTMLPPSCVEAFSLDEGREVAVLSLYVDVLAESFEILAQETRVERVRIAANLRHDQLDEVVTEERVASGTLPIPFGEELGFLWRFARTLLLQRETARGRPEPLGRIDYTFVLDKNDDGDEHAHVTLRPRRRGAPLDLVVAELMILANSTWGEWLARCGRVGIYRSQSMGRVRMSTRPAPHDGIGVDHYAWSTSPLRRYVDLVNQRQLIAAARGEPPPYASNDAELFATVSAFDATYATYAEFQMRMERYWCLRWLRQEGITRIGATVLKDEVLRLDDTPYVARLPGLPSLVRGQRVEVDILGADEIETTLELRLHRVLEARAETDATSEEDLVAVVETAVGDASTAGTSPQAG